MRLQSILGTWILIGLCRSSYCRTFYVDYEQDEEPDSFIGSKNMEESSLGTGMSPTMLGAERMAVAAAAVKRTDAESTWTSSPSESSWDGGSSGMIRHRLVKTQNERPRATTSSETNGWLNVPRPILPFRLVSVQPPPPIQQQPQPQIYNFQQRQSPRRSVVALRKRQSILFRQCFFNPISCFKK